MLRSYLDIQGMRFGARLDFQIDLPPALAEAEIPPMLIQPLVENAVTHGIEPCMRRRQDHAVCPGSRRRQRAGHHYADSGVGFCQGHSKGSGMGLTHVRERLARIFGATASMQMEENTPRGVVVRVTPAAGTADRSHARPRARPAPGSAPAMAAPAVSSS